MDEALLTEDEAFEAFELLGRLWREGEHHLARIIRYCLFRSTQHAFDQVNDL